MKRLLPLLIALLMLTLIAIGAALSKPKTADPKVRKPTAEAIILFNEVGEHEGYLLCPDCGLAHYMHVKLTGSPGQQVAVVTFWYDRHQTRKHRVHIFGGDPFDPMSGFSAGEK